LRTIKVPFVGTGLCAEEIVEDIKVAKIKTPNLPKNLILPSSVKRLRWFTFPELVFPVRSNLLLF